MQEAKSPAQTLEVKSEPRSDCNQHLHTDLLFSLTCRREGMHRQTHNLSHLRTSQRNQTHKSIGYSLTGKLSHFSGGIIQNITYPLCQKTVSSPTLCGVPHLCLSTPGLAGVNKALPNIPAVAIPAHIQVTPHLTKGSFAVSHRNTRPTSDSHDWQLSLVT